MASNKGRLAGAMRRLIASGMPHPTPSVRKALKAAKNESIFEEYYGYVEDIISHPEVQRLAEYKQHGDSDRLQHSISVSFMGFLIARRFKLDARATARGGMLHDLFFYYSQDKGFDGLHFLVHPKIALANSEALFDLTEKEKEIIACHMFPVCTQFPRYWETQIIQLVDKYCATNEALAFIIKKGFRRAQVRPVRERKYAYLRVLSRGGKATI